ncbi:MAG: family 20 glycosylhydrolase [Crocinitomicaceae bacterium]
MNKILQVLILISSWLILHACQQEIEVTPQYRLPNEITIIPMVQDIEIDSGCFKISEETVILVWNDSTGGAQYLKSLIEASSNFSIPIIKIKENEFKDYSNYIILNNQSKTIGTEYYDLNIDSNRMAITAMTNVGVMHGIQTLRQLFVNAFHRKGKRDAWYLPSLRISDMPKFKHRGLLLDCSRHWFKKEVVKKYIDLLSLYKMNILHWHLTEDQGWRIEIDSYPKLTEIGAWRTELDGSRYGGFYSKTDIKEIVAYAAEREITIVPEIELPGHSQAAIAAYPPLSCTGREVEVANDWGVFKEIYCAGNDSVFHFIENVLDEVLELFPGKYIHIGGDEAPKFRWESCNKCQKRIKDNNLEDEHELQSYFIGRVEKYLNNKGRKLIGWDEILEGGLSDNATVQSWRGMEGGVLAAKSEHEAIMSPTSHAYFDYDLKSIDLEKVYHFDPIPKDLTIQETQYIIGGECNMWSEHVPNDSVLDTKVFPRLLAMSEVLWAYPEKRVYNKFYHRVQGQYPILEALGVQYGAETVPIIIDALVNDKKVSIEARPGHESLMIKYKWNCDTCQVYLLYQNPVKIIQSGTLQFLAFKNDSLYGVPVKQKVKHHKALGEVVVYKSLFNKWYESKRELALVDGRLGSIDFKDGCWQGFWGDDIVVTIDLGKNEKVSELETHFFQYNNSWIFIPTEIIFEGSRDGENFYELVKMKAKTNPKSRGKSIEGFSCKIEGVDLQYVRLRAKNIGKVPDWHEAAGSDAWLFIDEIVIK